MSGHQPNTLAIAGLAAIGGAALVAIGVLLGLEHSAAAVVVALGLLLPVRVPWGGSVPMGVAGLAATVALDTRVEAASTLVVALLVGGVVLVCRRPRAEAFAAVERFAAGIAGALVAAEVLRGLVGADVPVLTAAIVASVGVTAGDMAVVRFRRSTMPRIEPRSALPVHLTLACAGALIAVSVSEVGVAMAAVAAFPLLITRFSFERYAGATDTLQQTVQALGLVPELAGLAPLGHSERSAAYASALCRELGFNHSSTTRVVTATRLHHLGSVPLEADSEHQVEVPPGDVALAGAKILREAKFPSDVADLLASANAETLDAGAPTLEAAVVRVAATFDEIVGDDTNGADRGLAIVTGAARDQHSRRAAAALLELVAADSELVHAAVAAGDRFRDAATDLDLQAVTTSRGHAGELLPFTRRG